MKLAKPGVLTRKLRLHYSTKCKRRSSIESTEGDAVSATKELGAIKSPDDKVETASARDTREDSAESMQHRRVIS